MKTITYAQAINEAMREEMRADEKVFFIGEDIGVYHKGKGPSGASIGMLDEFGTDRVIETPIEESAIVGGATGAALCGMRPIVEIMHSEFLCHCFEHVFYGGTKGAVMTDGHAFPLVIRGPYGGKTPGQLVQDENNEAWFRAAPGLKIVAPSTPYDAKGMMKAAIRDDYPVLFMEHKGLYKESGEVPEEEYVLPLNKADIKKEGTDVTVITYGRMVHVALAAAKKFEGEGVSIEVLDLRSISPLDEEAITASVKKTGRAVILHEARRNGGIGGEVAAVIAEQAVSSLKAPVVRITCDEVPANFPPTEAELTEGIRRVLS